MENSILVPKIEVLPANAVGDQPQAAKPPRKFGRNKKITLGVLLFVAVFIIYNIVAAFIVYRSAMRLTASSDLLIAAVKSQDITRINKEIEGTKASLNNFANSYKLLAWIKIVPYFGGYVKDGGHVITAGQAGLAVGQEVLTTISPYADLLGLSGGTSPVLGASNSPEKTAQDRIDFVAKSIPDLVPKIDSISSKVKIVQAELSQINADRYPEKYKGHEVRSKIKGVQDLLSEASTFIANGKPMLAAAPYLLGMDSPRTYMLLFQNDKELRPTGGFMTGYAIMKVDKAKFDPTSSDDIYNLDAKYKPSIPAPAPLVKYIKGPYILSKNLRLRDMNWSPDLPESMGLFTDAIKSVGIKNIDGVILVDTQLLVNLLKVMGPIGVPGFGNFSDKIDPQCNCPQVIHELESFADVEGPIIWDPLTGKIIQRPANSDNRKRIIGPLMNSILANAMAQPKDKLAPLFEAGFKSLMEKHVLFYLLDQEKEKVVSDFGIGGSIKDYKGDYIHINDANLGGRKSNLYATEEVEQDITVSKDGHIEKTVTIIYKNPEKQDGWLNSVLPTWVRVYVPKGSTLVTSEGLEEKIDPYEDLGKTVFAGYFKLRPEGVSKVTFKYKLPFGFKGDYKLLIQKQPGTDGFLYTIKLGKHSDEFYLKNDKEITIGL